MNILSLIVFIGFVINIILVLAMIFIERKKPQIIISWLVVLSFFPIFGFILYVLIGSGLSYKTRRMLNKQRIYRKEYDSFVSHQKEKFTKKEQISKEEKGISDILLFNMNNSNSAYYPSNEVRIFCSGEDKILALKKDLLRAKKSINLLYYIFADDKAGQEIMSILIEKAKQGVKVKLLYDSVGSLKTKRRFFKQLEKSGGEVEAFFPPLFGIRLMNLKMNYRNHRKVAVIDGKIGYTGGINIRDDHMGRKKKLSPWRDTHIRVTGGAVFALQTAFFNDWRYVKNGKETFEKIFSQGYFPKVRHCGEVGMQVITSGPDLTDQPIRDAFVKMILSAKEKIFIQTPYFIPDDLVMSSIEYARLSGVEVNIMIPAIPDKKIVYMATLSHVKNLLPCGVNFYLYKGFIHSKTVMIDSKVVSIGTSNFDNRSFALNFEINAFLYGENFAKINESIFEADLSKCMQIDMSFFKRKPWYTKLGQAIFRLFSPLL